jgi:hypothetical protein
MTRAKSNVRNSERITTERNDSPPGAPPLSAEAKRIFGKGGKTKKQKNVLMTDCEPEVSSTHKNHVSVKTFAEINAGMGGMIQKAFGESLESNLGNRSTTPPLFEAEEDEDRSTKPKPRKRHLTSGESVSPVDRIDCSIGGASDAESDEDLIRSSRRSPKSGKPPKPEARKTVGANAQDSKAAGKKSRRILVITTKSTPVREPAASTKKNEMNDVCFAEAADLHDISPLPLRFACGGKITQTLFSHPHFFTSPIVVKSSKPRRNKTSSQKKAHHPASDLHSFMSPKNKDGQRVALGVAAGTPTARGNGKFGSSRLEGGRIRKRWSLNSNSVDI